MKLQTTLPLSPQEDQIEYSSKILLLGSCFTENIGGKLDYFKFQNLQNPFGIVFHPLAIENLIARAVNRTDFTEKDIFERDGQWFSFEAHSSVTATSKRALLHLLNDRLKQVSSYLSEASHIILTFGTAWVYRHIASDSIVANCHKVPQKSFSKEILSVADISASVERTVALINKINQKVQLIFTVSPVRHTKDGFVENTQSKAHLIAAIHERLIVSPRAQSRGLFYFPSFELMMDELRDYRFYNDDMVHPSTTAVQYIWEKFKHVWVSSETETLQKDIDVIQKGLQHRPFQPDSVSHLKFQQDLQQKIEKIKQQLSYVVSFESHSF